MLYQQQCSASRAGGHADGPWPQHSAAADRSDSARTRSQRTPFALHQIITNGVEGTAMSSFAALPEADRWALAFFVGTLAYSDADKAAGAKRWQPGSPARQAIVDLAALTQSSQQSLAQRLGDADVARELTAYLRANPAQVEAAPQERTAIARTRLEQSVEAVRTGDRAAAHKLALSAYSMVSSRSSLLCRTRPRAFKKIGRHDGLPGRSSKWQSEQVQASAQHCSCC
jgi:high-affinity iron transporter